MPMPAPPVNQLSAEAQHVVNALEAHFTALRKLVDAGGSEISAYVERLEGEVKAAIEAFGGKFAAEPAETGAGEGSDSPAVSGSPTATTNT